MKSSDKDELLEENNFWGIISDNEYKHLHNNLIQDVSIDNCQKWSGSSGFVTVTVTWAYKNAQVTQHLMEFHM